MRICWSNSGDSDQAAHVHAMVIVAVCHVLALDYLISSSWVYAITRKDMALSAISMKSALADKEFVLSLHHKLHVSTCINKPNDVHKHINQFFTQSINHFYINNNETSLRDETISRYLFKEGVL